LSETRNGAEWEWRRREAIIRDDYTCQDCGDVGGPEGDTNLEVHHKTPVSEGGSNSLDNLITLCKSCHNHRHREERVNETDSGRRALLTPDERSVLMGDREVSDNHKYTVVSRVRKKIQKLDEDMAALEDYSDGKLLDELRTVVCDEEDTGT